MSVQNGNEIDLCIILHHNMTVYLTPVHDTYIDVNKSITDKQWVKRKKGQNNIDKSPAGIYGNKLSQGLEVVTCCFHSRQENSL